MNKLRIRFYQFMKFLRGDIVPFTPTYNEDDLITRHNCDFLNDPHFMRCYRLAVDEGHANDPNIHWRAHTACWAASHARHLEGDFVECGVNRGFLSCIVMEYIDFQNLPKRFYLLDTFEGLVDKYITDEERLLGRRAGGYAPCYDFVSNYFGKIENVRIIKGAVPETLSQVDSNRIAYLSIDMNCVIPEIAAAEYFWDKLVSGGIIILDDYGQHGHEPQRVAFDRFASDREIQVLSLPTSQGIILKP